SVTHHRNAPKNECPKPASANRRRNRRHTNRNHRRRSNSRQNHAQAQRKTHFQQDLRLLHPHRFGRLQHRRIQICQPHDRIPQNRQQPIQNQPNYRRSRSYSSQKRQRNQKSKQRQARNRL